MPISEDCIQLFRELNNQVDQEISGTSHPNEDDEDTEDMKNELELKPDEFNVIEISKRSKPRNRKRKHKL